MTLFAVVMAAAALQPAANSPALSIAAALADPARSETYRRLDARRRPAEVLAFAGLKPGMDVLDIGTGGGYYTEIIAGAVGGAGSVTGWNGPAFAFRPNVRQALGRIRARHPNAIFYATPTTSMALPRGQFDLILLHLTYHDFYWESADFGLARVETSAVIKELYDATKPGGAVVVIDHVARSGREPRAEADATHRIVPAVVRSDFEGGGFLLEAESDLLRLPDDDHSKRVFDPSIRGRTDRFMYRFRKPQ